MQCHWHWTSEDSERFSGDCHPGLSGRHLTGTLTLVLQWITDALCLEHTFRLTAQQAWGKLFSCKCIRQSWYHISLGDKYGFYSAHGKPWGHWRSWLLVDLQGGRMNPARNVKPGGATIHQWVTRPCPPSLQAHHASWHLKYAFSNLNAERKVSHYQSGSNSSAHLTLQLKWDSLREKILSSLCVNAYVSGHTCNPSTWELEAAELGVRDHPRCIGSFRPIWAIYTDDSVSWKQTRSFPFVDNCK